MPKKKVTFLMVRMEPDLTRFLQGAAKHERLSVSAYVRRMILQEMRQKEASR